MFVCFVHGFYMACLPEASTLAHEIKLLPHSVNYPEKSRLASTGLCALAANLFM